MGLNSFWLRAASGIVGTLLAFAVHAQTTAGIGTTIVFPLTAQTTSFASEVTLFNPGASAMTASVSFHEATNSSTPGRTTTCSDVPIAAGRSAQIVLTTQCDMTAASHFGLLIVADKASPQTHNFYGYMRVQNPQGIGFSVEGFPVENFNNQVSEATGLIKQAAAPGYQTNCFVGSLDQPVNYTVKLFNGASGAQIGSTLTGSLAAYKQFRYLDVFGSNGVNAPAGDQFNVRAEFTQTSGTSANLIGFCTVQDNTSFGADFRVAKSYGSPSSNFFAQGGNAFGTTATLGTTDNQVLNIIVNGARAMHFEPYDASPTIIGGYVNNGVYPGVYGATIAGGGIAGAANTFILGHPCQFTYGCQNSATDLFGTIGGGAGNLVGDTDGALDNNPFGTVAGGFSNAANGYAFVGGGHSNVASGFASVIGGGVENIASGNESVSVGGDTNVASGDVSVVLGGTTNTSSGEASFVAGGILNTASGLTSFAAGNRAVADKDGTFVWADSVPKAFVASTAWPLNINTFNIRATGGILFITGVDASHNPSTGLEVQPGQGAWQNSSDRNGKENIEEIEPRAVLEKLVAMPVSTWRWKTEDKANRHMGPMAQDFYAAFHLGSDDRHIGTIDADGVALAAIQGLNQLLQEKDAKIEAEERKITAEQEELSALKERLTQIETVLAQIQGTNKVAASQ